MVDVTPIWWNLDLFIAEQISINLRDYIKNSYGHPGNYTQESWNAKLASIATRLESYKANKFEGTMDQDKFLTEQAQEALREFADVFPSLWD